MFSVLWHHMGKALDVQVSLNYCNYINSVLELCDLIDDQYAVLNMK